MSRVAGWKKFMNIELLEEKLRRNPNSPLFARLAEAYVEAQRVEEAHSLCEKGLKQFPNYATAHLIAAKCSAELGKIESAQRHLELAMGSFPDNELLLGLRGQWADLPAMPSGPPQAIPPEEQSTETHTEEIHQDEPSSLEQLANHLQSVDRITPDSTSSPPREDAIADMRGADDSPIISVTLAEIYTNQGAYDAAIGIYRRLQQRKPQQAEEYEGKIRELMQKRR